VSGPAFAATHTQYPIGLQTTIAAVAMRWTRCGRQGGGLLAPYSAHMTLDWGIELFLQESATQAPRLTASAAAWRQRSAAGSDT